MEQITKQEKIIVAPLPSLPIAKGNAGASLLAHILVGKYVYHLPFYRQQQMLKNQGLDISRTTISNWFDSSTNLLEPLYYALQKQVFQSNYLQIDETPIGVQDSSKKGKLHMGYHWVHHAPVEGLVLFKYASNRSKKHQKSYYQSIMEPFKQMDILGI